ncbi:MAG: cyclic nucleotide-binding domain-containing protein [Gammaproteobacteria bacterium]|nr:cyclic nucleotide-binding domain-containing protein [Gammaproteobacteria bacterium]
MENTAQQANNALQAASQPIEHTTLLMVLGISGLLALAVLMVPLASRLKIPYTVMLAAMGILLGLIAELVLHAPWLGFLHEFVEALFSLEITSEAVFFVFLPALVFESALAIDVRRLFDDISPILMLAIVGLLISTAVIGFTMASVTGAALIICLLLGAIVSATDPVAVVAIFKDLGAPQRLAILVEGESLFNDATAIVVFTILSAMILGQSDPTLLSGLFSFAKVFFGGIFIGYLTARLCCFMLPHLGESNLPKISLTMSLAYLAFIIAEHSLHVSGVMAVVTAALVLGSRGRSIITPSAWHGLEEVWEQLGFIANSVIFILVGLKVPSILASMTAQHLTWLGILLTAGFSARFVVIFGLVPVMGRLGLAAEVSKGYRAVMFWGGLRGAVSLALALAVMENDNFPAEVQQFIGIMVTGYVLFTLAVNATTVHLVMRAFGLGKLSPTDEAVRDRAFQTTMRSVSERVRSSARAMHIGEQQTDSVVKPFETLAREGGAGLTSSDITAEDWRLIGLRMITMSENKAYHKMLDEGEISPEIARNLFGQSADISDSLRHGGVDAYVATYKDKLDYHWQTKLAILVQRYFGLPRFLAKRLATRFQILEAECTALHELRQKGLAQVQNIIGEDACAEVAALLEQRDIETERALAGLRACYPEYAEALERRMLQQTAMRLEYRHYKEMQSNSLIGKEVTSKLLEQMAERYTDLQQNLTLDLGLEADVLIAKMPFFSGLQADSQQAIAKLLKPRLALPGETIFEQGGPPDAMYFISSGAVRVQLGDGDVMLGSGDFFGEMALLTDQPRMASVKAEGFCELLTLSKQDFRQLLQQDNNLRSTIENVAKERTQSNQG